MAFTRDGTEYDQLDKGLATGAFRPWSRRLRNLRTKMAKDSWRTQEKRQSAAAGETKREQQHARNKELTVQNEINRGQNQGQSDQEMRDEDLRDKLKRMGLLS